MKEFSVPMALLDFVPVILFFLGASTVLRKLKAQMKPLPGVMYVVGFGLVTAAGCLKALYKLLYALGAGDFGWMSGQFFPNQAFGFLLAGVGLLLTVLRKKGEKVYSVIPTMALVGVMVAGVCAMDASLGYLASQRKKRGALVCFIISFFLILGMGYLSSKNFDKASMNWLAQGINIAGQLLFFIGCRSL